MNGHRNWQTGTAERFPTTPGVIGQATTCCSSLGQVSGQGEQPGTGRHWHLHRQATRSSLSLQTPKWTGGNAGSYGRETDAQTWKVS